MDDNFMVVCAWCGAHLSGNRSATVVSHGICDLCMVKEFTIPPPPPPLPLEVLEGEDLWGMWRDLGEGD